MTGITKDELRQMARDAGIALNEPTDGYCLMVGIPVGSIATTEGNVFLENLQSLINAALERAAVDLEKGKSATVIGSETEWGDGWKRGVSDALDGAQNSIRALKINTGG